MVTKKATKKTAAADKESTPEVKSPKVTLVKGAQPNFRKGSARELYYNVFAEHAGKTLAEVEAACTKSVPSTPKKGKLAGQAEPFSGWARWFVRNGYIQLEG